MYYKIGKNTFQNFLKELRFFLKLTFRAFSFPCMGENLQLLKEVCGNSDLVLKLRQSERPVSSSYCGSQFAVIQRQLHLHTSFCLHSTSQLCHPASSWPSSPQTRIKTSGGIRARK
ncbi:hypothetical protein GOODEAATRI_024595 [Goodea atripinnis]|uniref:Uncharacterized protein n=1 Tax=Goodea atripinnis TaxID=208336 RepID=A0ABV0MKF4_9TELE